jgi:hypothetical protein
LGTFIPSALESMKSGAASFVPWAWGINGIFSVLAPLLAMAISMTFGMQVLLLASIPFYLTAGLAFPPEGMDTAV